MRDCTNKLPASRVIKDARVTPDITKVSGSSKSGVAAGKLMYKRFYGKGED